MLKKEKVVVLIVDDHEDLAHTLKTILEREGYRADLAFDGTNALGMGLVYPYDAVILDMKLPDMDGTDLIKKLLEFNPYQVIIMLTGYPNQQNTMDALNLGARGYLTKPVDLEKLLKMLEDKLQQQRESMELTQERIGEFIKIGVGKLVKNRS